MSAIINSLYLSCIFIILAACQQQHYLPEREKTFSQEAQRSSLNVLHMMSPVSLRHGEMQTRRIRVTSEDYENGTLSSTKSQTMAVRIEALGDTRIWTLDIDDLREDERTLAGPGTPLVVIRASSTALGPLENVRLSFPGFEQLGFRDIPKPGEPMYEAFLNQIRSYFSISIPIGPLSFGSTLWRGRELVGLFAGAFPNLNVQMQSDNMQEVVTGVTTISGIQVLSTGISGCSSVVANGRPLGFCMSGVRHIALDGAVTVSARTRMELISRQGTASLVTFLRVDPL